ncbi:MAG: SGNH/GDSL hydrolase family protein [Ruminococcus sp.]|nr:SGNH/GDSL hydrolase family protein [Ruminococcus sp.]
MSYDKLNFVNGQAPKLNAQNLNHMDDGIADAHEKIADLQSKADEMDESTLKDAEGSVSSNNIAKNAVNEEKIFQGAVTNTKIAAKAIAAYHMGDNSVPERTIVDGAVSSEKLAKNAVTEEKLQMGAVTNTKLATDSVSATKIQNGVVSADKLANGAVITDKLRDASVTTVKMAIGSVTNTRLADGAVSKEKLDENLMPLIGKAIYQNGDSVAAGDGANGNSYFDIIANKYSMVETDKSIGGTTIAVSDFNIKTLSDGTKKDYKSIYERVDETMVGNFDYIILEGGWNDMFASVPLGSLTEHYVQNIEDLNVETTIGATEAICKLLIDRYFDIPKLFVLGHKKIDWKQETDWLPRQNAYWDGIISALEKWGIPYVDLRYESNLAAWNQTIADTYFYHKVVDGVDQGGDGTHPNYEAYKKFYVPPIEKALLYGVNTQPKKSLISNALGDTLIPEMSYYLGEQSEVTLAFPSKIKTTGSEIYINFISGETATTLISSGCIGLKSFVPNANSVCEINAKYNGAYWICKANQTSITN